MIRKLLIGSWLTLVWVALWGEVSAANLISGVFVAAAALIPFPLAEPEQRGAFRPWGAVRYLAFFARQLAVANAVVAWEVVTPRNRDDEGIVALPVVESCSETALSLLVNSIGLTPGTMVIDLAESPRTIFVHVLHLGDREAARSQLMRFQELVIRAFGSTGAVAELDAMLADAARSGVSDGGGG